MNPAAALALKFYQLTTSLIAPLGACFLAYKRRRDPPYGSRFCELLGHYRLRLEHCVWFHAASMGEVNSLKPLLRKFMLQHPQEQVVLSTLTTTGNEAAEALKGLNVVYAPLDAPWCIQGFFRALKPKALFIVDTELWPNLLHACVRHHCPVTIINARMREQNCVKYERLLWLSKPLLAEPLGRVLCVSDDDAQRFERIGVSADRLEVTGNLKYDLTPNEQLFKDSKAYKDARHLSPVLGVISSHEGEEELLLESYFTIRQQVPRLSLVLVPRHKSGVENAQKFLNSVDEEYTLRDNKQQPLDFSGGILLGATMGEIERYFGLCDLVFMGGSFVRVGGHNPLEPAYYSLPCITGPYYHNFQEAFDRLIEAGGAFLANDHKRLVTLTLMLLQDQEKLFNAGISAFEIQQEGRGALKNTLNYISLILDKLAVKAQS
ncbi:MAG: hypothetical protein K6F05_03280 [Succinivibrio sp.]|nr:hypothetical protein [Succinivibrio sp.]